MAQAELGAVVRDCLFGPFSLIDYFVLDYPLAFATSPLLTLALGTSNVTLLFRPCTHRWLQYTGCFHSGHRMLYLRIAGLSLARSSLHSFSFPPHLLSLLVAYLSSIASDSAYRYHLARPCRGQVSEAHLSRFPFTCFSTPRLLTDKQRAQRLDLPLHEVIYFASLTIPQLYKYLGTSLTVKHH